MSGHSGTQEACHGIGNSDLTLCGSVFIIYYNEKGEKSYLKSAKTQILNTSNIMNDQHLLNNSCENIQRDQFFIPAIC